MAVHMILLCRQTFEGCIGMPIALIEERLRDRKYSGRQLGTLLLDQHFVAGLGNYLRCEILFLTGLSPEIKPKQLSTVQLENVASRILEVSRQSYQAQGITNDLERVEILKKKGLTRSQYRHHIFARAYRTCYSCGQPVINDFLSEARLLLQDLNFCCSRSGRTAPREICS